MALHCQRGPEYPAGQGALVAVCQKGDADNGRVLCDLANSARAHASAASAARRDCVALLWLLLANRSTQTLREL
jgi:hypothetical protein